MTAIKICGIKDSATLALLGHLGVEYAGFIFAPSKRQVTAEQVGRMLAETPNFPVPVGVFVNPELEELDIVLKLAPLAVIQLHGQESPLFCQEVKQRYGVQVWKAVSVKDDGGSEINEIDDYKLFVDAFLFDTHDSKQAGGTGKAFSWEKLPMIAQKTANHPYFVAGGIREANVLNLIEKYHPSGVDISSGVETNGQKEPDKIRKLVEGVRDYEQNRF